MAWTFKKRIKIIPGIHLNFSKSGISTSIGVPGATLNLSSKGTHLTTSIPGTGISHRQKFSGGASVESETEPRLQQPELSASQLSPAYDNNIFSADIEQITSMDLIGIKQAILSAHQQKQELRDDLNVVELALKSYKNKLLISKIFLYGFLMKNYRNELEESIDNQKQAITGLKDRIENSFVHLKVSFEDELETAFKNVFSTFQNVINCKKIWDITAEHSVDQFATRSAAATSVFRSAVNFKLGHLPEIKSEIPAMIWQNRNGGDIYFYPNFIIMWNSRNSFAVVGFDELDIACKAVRFVEEEEVPSDTEVVDHTWLKVNKDGSPDRRFSHNYQIPICKYGDVSIKTQTGLNESYEFSNYEVIDKFTKCFLEYQIAIINLEYVPSVGIVE